MEPPEILYHYTDAKGLLGILDSKQIWATSYRFMNDSREFEYGFDLISEIFPENLEELDLEVLAEGNIPDSSYAYSIRKCRWTFQSDCLFVAAFSVLGDLLSQWRGYSGLHSGYSLGFRSKELKLLDEQSRLVACCYEKNIQLDAVKGLVNKYLPEMKAEKDVDKIIDIAYIAATEMALKSTTLKHAAFKEEQEWRIIVGPLDSNNKRICYRVAERAIIPYVKIDFPCGFPLEHIIVGPSPNQERNFKSLLQMLDSKGFGKVKVSCSNAPLRTW